MNTNHEVQAACRLAEPGEDLIVEDVLKLIVEKLLSEHVPAWMRPLARLLVQTVLDRLLTKLREQAGLPAGVLASSSGYTQEQLDNAIAALYADLK